MGGCFKNRFHTDFIKLEKAAGNFPSSRKPDKIAVA